MNKGAYPLAFLVAISLFILQAKFQTAHATCVNNMTINGTPSVLPRDHASVSTISVRIFDCNLQPLSGPVQFVVNSPGEFSDGTNVNKTVIVDSMGWAYVDVRSKTISSLPGTIQVQATAIGITKTKNISLLGVTITLTKTKPKLMVLLGQTDTINATCRDTNFTPCKNPSITFTTSAGSFVGGGTSIVAPLSSSGTASAELQTSPTSSGNLIATIDGRIETLVGTSTMPFHRAAMKTELNRHQMKTSVGGSGGEEVTATVTVYDPEDGNAPVSGVNVGFHWTYPINASRNQNFTTGANGAISDILNVVGSEGSGQFQATAASVYDMTHPLKWKQPSFFLNGAQVVIERDGMINSFKAQFTAGNWNVSYDTSNGSRWSVGYGIKL